MSIGDWKRIDKPPEWTIQLTEERDGISYYTTLTAKDFDDAFVEKVAAKIKDDPVFRELIFRLLKAQ